jgi:hypothetical protein
MQRSGLLTFIDAATRKIDEELMSTTGAFSLDQVTSLL